MFFRYFIDMFTNMIVTLANPLHYTISTFQGSRVFGSFVLALFYVNEFAYKYTTVEYSQIASQHEQRISKMENPALISIIHITVFILIIFLRCASENENIKTKKPCLFLYQFCNTHRLERSKQRTEFLQTTTTVMNTTIDSNHANETADFDPDEHLYGGYYNNGYYYYDYDYDYDDEYLYPEYKDFDGQVCQDNWRCHGELKGYCFCDNLCPMYSDCCHDANITSDHGVHNQPFSCQYIPGVKDVWFVFIIDTCPGGTDYQLNELCIEPNERNIYITTLTSSSSTGFLYKNVHCAMCNGVVDYIFWKADLQCSWSYKDRHKVDNLTIEELLFRDECFMFYKPPLANITHRICNPHINSCPETTNDTTTLSTLYKENAYIECSDGDNKYIFTSDAIYKNLACYECNRRVNTNDSEATCDAGTFQLQNMLDVTRYVGPYTLNMLFDLSTQQLVQTTRSKRNTAVDATSFANRCESDEAFDPFNGECKLLQDINSGNSTKKHRNAKTETGVKKCSHVSFNRNDVELINDTIVQHLDTGTLYDSFRLFNNSVIICIEKEPHVRLKTFVKLDDIFHLSTNGVSMLSLLVTIFIYVRTSLHKLPGKCILCLSLSLLVAQSMLLIGPVAEGNVVFCKVASLVMHYSFMTSFTWMNVMAYDVYYSFSRHFQHSAFKGVKWFLKYSLYAWLLPFVLVTTSFIIDEFSSLTYSPKYADPICWINDPEGLLLFFLGPLAMIMLSNMLFFAMSLRNILHVVSHENRRHSKAET